MRHLILLITAALALHADSMALLSGVSAGGSNNIVGDNMLINPYPDWAVDPFANWISFDNTGYGGIVLPNTDMNTPTAIFYQDFELTEGTGVSGYMEIWADDFATVKLDGVVLFSANTVLGPLCSAGPIGCTQSNGGIIQFYAPGLSHRLEFEVFQRGLVTFGLMYDGYVESIALESPVSNPEPSTVSIMGLGLVTLGVGSRQASKRRSRRANGASTLTR